MSIVASGSLRAGKSYVLENLLGLDIKNVPDPIYAITEFYFGTRDKSLPGIRSFMQKIGQWGRGLVNEEHPATPKRAALTKQVRCNGPEMMSRAENPVEYREVDWDQFGRDEDFWVNVLSDRVETALNYSVSGQEQPEIGVPNARFPNEIIEMTAQGLDYYHVMCSRKTRRARVSGDLEEKESDRTEELANQLNALAMSPSVLEAVHEGSSEYDMLLSIKEEAPIVLDRIAFGDGVVWSDPHRPVPEGRDFLSPKELEQRYDE